MLSSASLHSRVELVFRVRPVRERGDGGVGVESLDSESVISLQVVRANLLSDEIIAVRLCILCITGGYKMDPKDAGMGGRVIRPAIGVGPCRLSVCDRLRGGYAGGRCHAVRMSLGKSSNDMDLGVSWRGVSCGKTSKDRLSEIIYTYSREAGFYDSYSSSFESG